MLIVPSMTLQATMSGSASTSDPEIHAIFIDWTPDNRQSVPLLQRSVLSDATDVTILDAPVNNQSRQVEQLYIYNKDSATQTVTVKTDDGTTERIVFKQEIESGRTFCYERGNGSYMI